jgi:hypothetical protein
MQHLTYIPLTSTKIYNDIKLLLFQGLQVLTLMIRAD